MNYVSNSNEGANRHDWACWGFIALSVIIAGVAFYSSGKLYLALVGLGFMLFSILQLSGALTRLKEAGQGGHWFTVGSLLLLTLVFMGVETVGVHYGLENINAAHAIIPVEYEWHASAGASAINFLGSYSFARTLEPRTIIKTAPPVIEDKMADLHLIDLSNPLDKQAVSAAASFVAKARHAQKAA